LVENQTGKKIKVLRSENGGDYTSKDFDAFCKEARIKRELTVIYNLLSQNLALVQSLYKMLNLRNNWK
jgi:hypothetical protein